MGRLRNMAVALLLSAPAWANLAAAQQIPNDSATTADQRLRTLYNAEWEWRLREFAREPGDPRQDLTADHLPRVDAATQQARLAYWTDTLRQLEQIPFELLSAEQKINAGVFRAVLAENIVDTRFAVFRRREPRSRLAIAKDAHA